MTRFPRKITKILPWLIIAAIPVGLCVVWYLAGGRVFVEPALYNKRMAKYLPEFDRLNQDVFSQIPIYPGAQQVGLSKTGLTGGVTLDAVVTPRRLHAIYISDAPPSQVNEFLVTEMLSQGWKVKRGNSSPPYKSSTLFRKNQSCVDIRVSQWEADSKTFTGYEPSASGEMPTSWYWVIIEHALDAVPGAPEPPSWTLFGCLPDSERP